MKETIDQLVKLFRQVRIHPVAGKNKKAAVLRFLRWQFATRISGYSMVVPFIGQSRLVIARGMRGATGNIYVGLFEFHDMSFVLHVLRPGDRFADIGANVGVYSVLASAVQGAHTIAVEPLPATVLHLRDNIRINGIEELVKIENVGLSSSKGVLRFTEGLDAVNHVVRTETAENTIEVPVTTVDDLFATAPPLVMKIDVEGYECPALEGAANTLASRDLKAIIIELNGSGARYGFDEAEIHASLLGKGFVACSYDPFARTLTELTHFGIHNTIYVRDMDFISQRVKDAPPYVIFGEIV